ncbi:MAG: hypothetical protein MR927_06560, partial [Campylobacter sp.]|nr:hypothetical protein [Campylobacter sp.]
GDGIVGNLEFPKPCVIPRLDRRTSSQNRDPPVKLGDGIVGNLEFLRMNLEFLEIASLRSQ